MKEAGKQPVAKREKRREPQHKDVMDYQQALIFEFQMRKKMREQKLKKQLLQKELEVKEQEKKLQEQQQPPGEQVSSSQPPGGKQSEQQNGSSEGQPSEYQQDQQQSKKKTKGGSSNGVSRNFISEEVLQNGVLIAHSQTPKEVFDGVYEVEEIRKIQSTGNMNLSFYVKWRGWSEADCTWEPFQHLRGCIPILQAFYKKNFESHRIMHTKAWQLFRGCLLKEKLIDENGVFLEVQKVRASKKKKIYIKKEEEDDKEEEALEEQIITTKGQEQENKNEKDKYQEILDKKGKDDNVNDKDENITAEEALLRKKEKRKQLRRIRYIKERDKLREKKKLLKESQANLGKEMNSNVQVGENGTQIKMKIVREPDQQPLESQVNHNINENNSNQLDEYNDGQADSQFSESPSKKQKRQIQEECQMPQQGQVIPQNIGNKNVNNFNNNNIQQYGNIPQQYCNNNINQYPVNLPPPPPPLPQQFMVQLPENIKGIYNPINTMSQSPQSYMQRGNNQYLRNPNFLEKLKEEAGFNRQQQPLIRQQNFLTKLANPDNLMNALQQQMHQYQREQIGIQNQLQAQMMFQHHMHPEVYKDQVQQEYAMQQFARMMPPGNMGMIGNEQVGLLQQQQQQQQWLQQYQQGGDGYFNQQYQDFNQQFVKQENDSAGQNDSVVEEEDEEEEEKVVNEEIDNHDNHQNFVEMPLSVNNNTNNNPNNIIQNSNDTNMNQSPNEAPIITNPIEQKDNSKSQSECQNVQLIEDDIEIEDISSDDNQFQGDIAVIAVKKKQKSKKEQVIIDEEEQNNGAGGEGIEDMVEFIEILENNSNKDDDEDDNGGKENNQELGEIKNNDSKVCQINGESKEGMLKQVQNGKIDENGKQITGVVEQENGKITGDNSGDAENQGKSNEEQQQQQLQSAEQARIAKLKARAERRCKSAYQKQQVKEYNERKHLKNLLVNDTDKSLRALYQGNLALQNQPLKILAIDVHPFLKDQFIFKALWSSTKGNYKAWAEGQKLRQLFPQMLIQYYEQFLKFMP